MPLRVVSWTAFAFLLAGGALLLIGPDWRPYGCGALLTSATIYGYAIWKVARQLADVKRRTQEMLERTARDLEKRKSN